MSSNPPGYMKKYFAANGHANYKKYSGTHKAILDRAKRNAARRKMGVKVGDTREVDHVGGMDAGNGRGNLRIISRSLNRKL